MADRDTRGNQATDPRDPGRRPVKLLGLYMAIAFVVAIAGVAIALGWGDGRPTTRVQGVDS